MRARALLLVAGVALAGCGPVLPFHFAETAETLQKKEVGLTVAAGGGDGARWQNLGISGATYCCAGGAARVRVGLGRGMEIGGELSVIGGRSEGPILLGKKYGPDVGSVDLAGKVSFKLSPVRWFAFIAGVGGSGFVTHNETTGELGHSVFFFGADVAAVFSTDPLARILRVYGGARFTFVVPVASDVLANYPTQGFNVPVGLSIAPSERLRLFVEAGLVGGFSETQFNGQSYRNDAIGGYGMFAFAYRWAVR